MGIRFHPRLALFLLRVCVSVFLPAVSVTHAIYISSSILFFIWRETCSRPMQ